MRPRNPSLEAAAGFLAWLVALFVRWQHLPVTSALLDATGPFLSAARSTVAPPPHAAIYGGALAWPHRLVSAGASSLWEACAALHALHALVAPVAVFALARAGAGPGACLLGGVVLALDAGLVDTAVSGAEGYFAPLWLGLVVAFGAARSTAVLAPIAFGLAVANHPLAVAGAPLLQPALRSRQARWCLVAVALLSIPQGLRLAAQPAGGGEAGLAVAWQAVLAWGEQAGWSGVAVAGGPLAGLCRKRTRSLALVTLLSAGVLLGLGGSLGYLRDHHLRLLSVPAVVCWTGFPLAFWAAAVAVLRPLPDPVTAPHHAKRPGTLGLETRIASVLEQQPGRFVVDGAWFSGTPAAEPGALLFDLVLRGVDPVSLDVGGEVVLLATAEREHLKLLTPGSLELVWRDDRAWLLRGTVEDVRDWTRAACSVPGLPPPRIGGAWDGLAVLHPERTAADTRAWVGCQAL